MAEPWETLEQANPVQGAPSVPELEKRLEPWDMLKEPWELLRPARDWQALGQRFFEGVQRDLKGLEATPTMLGAIIAEDRGDRETAIRLAKAAEAIEQQAPEAMWRLQDVRDPTDFAHWFVERFGENAITLLSTFTGAGAGALVGKLGVRALGGGLAMRQAAMKAGMLSGGFAVSASRETAGTAGEQFQVTGSTQPELSVPAGLAKGLLELWTPSKVISALALPGKQLGQTTLGAITRTAGREALTESLQEGIDIGLRMHSDPEYSFLGNGPFMMGEGAWRLAEAGVAGGMIGGVVGAGPAVVEQRQERVREARVGGIAPGGREQVQVGRPQTGPPAGPPTGPVGGVASEIPSAPVVEERNVLRRQPEGFVEVYRGDQTGFGSPEVRFAESNEPGLFFTTDLSEAEMYARGMQRGSEIGYGAGSNIRRTVLDTRNFKRLTVHPNVSYRDASLRQQAMQAQQEGYSGALVELPSRAGGLARTQYIVWDQKAILEAGTQPRTLKGTFEDALIPSERQAFDALSPAIQAALRTSRNPMLPSEIKYMLDEGVVPEKAIIRNLGYSPEVEGGAGPVTIVRNMVMRGPSVDRDLQQAATPQPKEDLLAVSPLLRSAVPAEVTEVYLDMMEANTKRYALQEANGAVTNGLLTDTDLEAVLALIPQGQKPLLYEVDQGQLVPAGITATVMDLPDAGSRRVWFLPGVSQAEQSRLLLDYAKLQALIEEGRRTLLGGATEQQVAIPPAMAVYNQLLSAGLRVVPSRGASMLYMGDAPLYGRRVEPPSTTGRAQAWMFLASNGALLTGSRVEGEVLSSQYSASIAGAIPVTVDMNKFKPGELSVLPMRWPGNYLPMLEYTGVKPKPGRDPKFGMTPEWEAQQDIRRMVELWVPEYRQPWTEENLGKFRALMRQGIYADPKKNNYVDALITSVPITRDKLVEGVNTAAIAGAQRNDIARGQYWGAEGVYKYDTLVDIAPNVEQTVVGQRLLAALNRLAPLVDKIFSNLGIEGRYRIVIRKPTELNLFTAMAWVEHGVGEIGFNVDSFVGKALASTDVFLGQVYSSLMHEVGHVVTMHYFKKMPVEIKQQIVYAYHKALLARRLNDPAGRAKMTSIYVDKPLDLSNADYFSSFVEWLAEQFRRFTDTDAVIRSELDKHYSDVAKAMEKFYKGMEDANPAAARDLRNPDYFISGFVQYLRDYGKEKERLKQLTRQQTLYAIGRDVYASPTTLQIVQQVLAALESMKHMMPTTHSRFGVVFNEQLNPELARPDRGAIARAMQFADAQNSVLIELAVGSLQPYDVSQLREVFAHELIHAYKMLGIITPEEMSTLYNAAIKDGKDLVNTEKWAIRGKYAALGEEQGWSEAAIELKIEEVIREEVVAYYVGEYARHGFARPEAVPILERIMEVLRRVAAFLRGAQYNTRDDILEAFFRGEMVSRGTREQQAQENEQRFMRAWFTPADIVWDEVKPVSGDVEARVEKNRDANGQLEYATYQFYTKTDNKIVGQVQLSVAPNRGFAVDMVYSRLPGAALQWVDFISRDTGLPVLAPIAFTAAGFRMATRQFPELTQYYVPDRTVGASVYYSPKYVQEQFEMWQRIAQQAVAQGRRPSEARYRDTREQLRYWRRLNARIPAKVWKDQKALDQMFMLPRNASRDGVQGSMVRHGVQADEAQLGQILGEAQAPGATIDGFSHHVSEAMNASQSSAAHRLGMGYELGSPAQPEVRNMRRILAWADYRGATTDPKHAGYLKKVSNATLISQEADRIGFFSRVYWGLRQLIWRNEHLGGLQQYGQVVERFNAVITAWHRDADDVARLWEKQVKDPRQRETLNGLMFWLVEMNYLSVDERARGVIRHPSQQELLREMTRRRLTPATRTFMMELYQHPVQVAAGARKDIFARFLDAVEQVSFNNILRTISDPVLQAKAVTEMRSEMNDLRAKPYFPITRFGKHTITVRDADPTRNNRVLWFSAYDNHIARDQALAEVAKKFPFDHIHKGRMPEEFLEFMGLPGPLLRTIRTEMPNLQPDQVAWLEELERLNLPDKSFRKRWIPRTGVGGYSMDAFRSFAHYFMHGSRYLARLQFKNDMLQAIQSVEASIVGLPNGSKRKMISDFMRKHYNYMMEGGKDWAKFKALVSMLQLGFSPAAAFMNLTQTPMVSLPWLNGTFGSSAGMAQLIRSSQAVRNLKRGYVTSGVGNYDVAREEMIRQGRIDIGQAAELGAFAEGNNLLGLLAGTKRQKMYRNFVWASMWMFQRAEQVNREWMMHAAWELAHKQMKTNKRIKVIERHYMFEAMELQSRLSTPARKFTWEDAIAFILAKEALDQTQGVYAPYARPGFMRHPVAGTLLIFYQFIQLMTYAFRYNPGQVQMFLLMAMVYGVAGLPGAEELNELFRLLGKRIFGKDFDAKTQARRMVREITRGTVLDEVGPDLFLHGISRYGFGLGLLPDGYAIGKFDASANGSMGKLIPGLYEALHAANTAAKPDQFVSDVSQRLAGAGFGWFFNLVQFGMESPGTVDGHSWEQALPRTMRAMAAAYRYTPPEVGLPQLGPLQSVGAATRPSGAAIARFSATDPEDVAAIVTQFLGFRPTKVSQAQEYVRAENEMERIYMARRGALFVQLTAATLSGRPEVQQEVMNAIGRFNEEVAADGFPALGITNQQMRQSQKGRERGRLLQEEFTPQQRMMRGPADRLRDLFPGVKVQQVK